MGFRSELNCELRWIKDIFLYVVIMISIILHEQSRAESPEYDVCIYICRAAKKALLARLPISGCATVHGAARKM